MSSIKPPSSDLPKFVPSASVEAAEKTTEKTPAVVDAAASAPEAHDEPVAPTPPPTPSVPIDPDAPRLAVVFADNMAPLVAALTTTAEGGDVQLDAMPADYAARSSLHQSYQPRTDRESLNDFILMRLATLARLESSDEDDESKRDAIKREQKAARIKRQATVSERRHDANELLEMSKVSHGWPARSDLLTFVEPTVVAWASAVHVGPPTDPRVELDGVAVVGPERVAPLAAPLAVAGTELNAIAQQQGVSAMLNAMPGVIEQALARAGFAPELQETQEISRALQGQVLASLFAEAPTSHGDLGLLAAVVGTTFDREGPSSLPSEPAAVVATSLESALSAIREWAERGVDRQSRKVDLLP